MKMNLCSFLISQNFSFLKTSLISKEKDEEEELHHHLYHTFVEGEIVDSSRFKQRYILM